MDETLNSLGEILPVDQSKILKKLTDPISWGPLTNDKAMAKPKNDSA